MLFRSRVKRNRWRTQFVLINLAIVTFTNCDNTVFENGRPKITSTKYLLCSSVTRHVSTTGANVTIIQYFLSFLEGQTSTEYRINLNAIERIYDYTIMLRVMLDTMKGILCQLRSEFGSLEIYDDITIPQVKGANQEKCIIQNTVLGMRWSEVGREGTNQISKN